MIHRVASGAGVAAILKMTIVAASLALLTSVLPADEPQPVFSGPQPGEPLPSFRVRTAFTSDDPQESDPVSAAEGKPLVVVFVHDVNRQSVSFVRTLSGYTHSRLADGLQTSIVFLHEDPAEAERLLQRIRHALTAEVHTGISLDGREGPGVLGLHRKVMLTILVAKENTVTSSFALIQPSLQADLPDVLKAVVDVVGGEVPDLADLPGMKEQMARNSGRSDVPNLRPYLMPLIQRDADEAAVDKAAEEIEKLVASDEAARKELARIAVTIVKSGRLENYGTPHAQKYLRHWAVTYGDLEPEPDDASGSDRTADPATSDDPSKTEQQRN